jgi:hypothetical protein
MTRILLAPLFALALVGPACAEDALPATGTQSSLGSLLDSGYQIISAQPLSPEDQKSIWPNDAVAAYVMLILQRGPSIASCVMATSTIINVSPQTLALENGCRVR